MESLLGAFCAMDGRRLGILNAGAFWATRLTLATLLKVSFGALVMAMSIKSSIGGTSVKAVDCVQMKSSSLLLTPDWDPRWRFEGLLGPGIGSVRKAPRLLGVNFTLGFVAVLCFESPSLAAFFLAVISFSFCLRTSLVTSGFRTGECFDIFGGFLLNDAALTLVRRFTM